MLPLRDPSSESCPLGFALGDCTHIERLKSIGPSGLAAIMFFDKFFARVAHFGAHSEDPAMQHLY